MNIIVIANNQTVEVLHGMEELISTWGDLCECAGIEQGETPEDTVVTKKLSAISLLSKGEGERGDSKADVAAAVVDVAVADTEQSNYNERPHGPVAELADAGDLKSPEDNTS